MPTIAILSGCSIAMYAGDHQPPHFHVRMRDGREVLVGISNVSVLRGTVPRRELIEALDWAAAHHAILEATWQELNP